MKYLLNTKYTSILPKEIIKVEILGMRRGNTALIYNPSLHGHDGGFEPTDVIYTPILSKYIGHLWWVDTCYLTRLSENEDIEIEN